MEELLKFELVSPEKLLMSKDVTSVTVPGVEGDFGVMVNHAPLLSSLRPGVLDVTGSDGTQERIFVGGGFAEISKTGLTVLASETTPLAELSADKLTQLIKDAEEDLTDAKGEEKQRIAQESLDHLKLLQASL